MQNILLIAPSLEQGGLERICLQTAKLLKTKYRVSIVLFDARNIHYDTEDIEIIDLNKPSKPSVTGKVLNVLARTIELNRLKKQRKADVALSFGPTAAFPNVLFKTKTCKSWISFHSHMDLDSSWKGGFLGKRADRVICCSKGIEEEMIDRFGLKNIETVYNPYDSEDIIKQSNEFEANLDTLKEEFIVATMGRDNEIKGYWHLLKAFSLFVKEKPDSKLMMIGDGSYSECKQLAKDLGISEKVIFTGVQKNPYPFLKKADMYVLSSINEGFPNALIEALSLSIPIVATDCLTGPAEILMDRTSIDTKEVIFAEYGVLVPRVRLNNNYDSNQIEKEDISLAEGMLSLVNSPEKIQNYKLRAFARANDFSGEQYIRKLFG